MKHIITIPQDIEQQVRSYLFQNELEQGAFLFAETLEEGDIFRMQVKEAYLVPPDGWRVQLDVYLEMTDEERARIMKRARDGGYAAIDCHSHPGSGDEVEFSLSDRVGIADFAPYVRWKLGGKPFAALVWGEASLDGVIWHGDFQHAQRIDKVEVTGKRKRVIRPRATWFRRRSDTWRGRSRHVV